MRRHLKCLCLGCVGGSQLDRIIGCPSVSVGLSCSVFCSSNIENATVSLSRYINGSPQYVPLYLPLSICVYAYLCVCLSVIFCLTTQHDSKDLITSDALF